MTKPEDKQDATDAPLPPEVHGNQGKTLAALRAADDAGFEQTFAEQQEERVGYGRPPKHGQFKKGQSGNPKGRPKKRTDLHEEVLKVYTEPLEVRKGEKITTVHPVVATHLAQRNRALKGDHRAALIFLKNAKELGAFDQDESDLPRFSDEFLERLKPETLKDLIRMEMEFQAERELKKKH